MKVFENSFLLILELVKGSEYVFRVQALTVNGSGPTSAWLMKETLKHDLDGTGLFVFMIF